MRIEEFPVMNYSNQVPFVFCPNKLQCFSGSSLYVALVMYFWLLQTFIFDMKTYK